MKFFNKIWWFSNLSVIKHIKFYSNLFRFNISIVLFLGVYFFTGHSVELYRISIAEVCCIEFWKSNQTNIITSKLQGVYVGAISYLVSL